MVKNRDIRAALGSAVEQGRRQEVVPLEEKRDGVSVDVLMRLGARKLVVSSVTPIITSSEEWVESPRLIDYRND